MNLCLDAQRRRGRSERVDLEQEDEAEIEAAMDPPSAALAGPQRQALNSELRGKIEEALASLSENHRAILLLRELEGLSYEELSKVLGIRKGTVMSRLFHARLKMQNKLRDYLGAEAPDASERSEEHTSELQSLRHLVCRLLLEKKKNARTYQCIDVVC